MLKTVIKKHWIWLHLKKKIEKDKISEAHKNITDIADIKQQNKTRYCKMRHT